MSKTYTNPETIGLHAGWRKDDSTNSVAVPIHQTSSFQFDDCDHAASVCADEPLLIVAKDHRTDDAILN